jgi:hypothetical protein
LTKTINIFVYDQWTYYISWIFGSNLFNATCDLTQNHVLQKSKCLWIEMFEMNDIMVKKTQGKQIKYVYLQTTNEQHVY